MGGEEDDGRSTPIGGSKTIQDGVISAFAHGSDFEVIDTGATSTAGL